MRMFQCITCSEVNSLYDWNTNAEVYKQWTLHEIKDFEELKMLRKMIIFSCPSCKQELVPDQIKEVAECNQRRGVTL